MKSFCIGMLHEIYLNYIEVCVLTIGYNKIIMMYTPETSIFW